MITVKDKYGTFTKARRGGEGAALDRTTARHYAVVSNEWSRAFATKREAEAEERRMKDKAARGVKLGRDRITLAEFIADVWLPHARRRVKQHTLDEGTLEAYSLLIDAHIVPMLGPMKLRNINEDTLQAFYIERAETRGWKSAKTAQNLHALVSNILSLAVDRDFIEKNPAKKRNVRPGDRGMQKVHAPVALTPEEARVLLGYTSTDRFAAAWRLILVGGLRRGEALGLEWSDIDLDAGRVCLERTWKRLPKSRRDVTGPIKTGKPRTISVDSRTCDMLREHRERQKEERELAAECWHDDDVVFSDEVGRRIVPQTFSRRFGRLIGTAVRDGHLHELRHTAVTMAVNAGMAISVAAERFGHSPKVMLSVYTHTQREQQDAAARTLAAVIDG